MPKKLKVQLSEEQRHQLNAWTARNDLTPRLRLRLEMVRLSSLGLEVAQLAATLEVHPQTVGKYLNAFNTGGFEALKDKPHPGLTPKLKATHLAALEAELDQAATEGQRTYTCAQLVEWLEEHYKLKVHPIHLARVLKQRGFSYKRTKTSLHHKKKDLPLQARKEADLETLT